MALEEALYSAVRICATMQGRHSHVRYYYLDRIVRALRTIQLGIMMRYMNNYSKIVYQELPYATS